MIFRNHKKMVIRAFMIRELIFVQIFLLGIILSPEPSAVSWAQLPPSPTRTPTPGSVISKPQRIISCSLATDELALALIPSQERQRIVALSAYANDQTYSNIPYLKDTPLISHPQMVKSPCHGENLEPLLHAKPDLVLLAAYSSPLLKFKLEQNNIKFYQAPSPRSLDEIGLTIKSLAQALGEEMRGQELFTRFSKERQDLKSLKIPQTLQHRRVIHLFSDGTISGQNTIFDSLAQEIPFINQASKIGLKSYAKSSLETLLTLNPDTIIIGGDPLEQRDLALKRLRAIPGIDKLKGFSQERLVIIPERELSSVSHHLLRGLRRLKEELIRLESP